MQVKTVRNEIKEMETYEIKSVQAIAAIHSFTAEHLNITLSEGANCSDFTEHLAVYHTTLYAFDLGLYQM